MLFKESEDSEAEDRQLDDMLDQDFNWELEVGRRKKRWTQKEIELRTERSEKTVQQTSSRQFQVVLSKDSHLQHKNCQNPLLQMAFSDSDFFLSILLESPCDP